VRAYGDILKQFKHYHKHIEVIKTKGSDPAEKKWVYKDTPIVMHSYGGSKEITRSLLKLNSLNLYFSLSLKRS
jgi:Tat protein secretion system quality control protein TatD with DNase activity